MYLFFLLCQYKPIKYFIMKNVLLFAMVALATIGYSQDASVPNVKIKTKSYRTYETVDYLTKDSSWYSFDSLTIELSKCTALVYGYEDTTTGYYTYNFEPVERIHDYRTRQETFSFNFTDSTLTRVSLTSFQVDHISYFFEVYGKPGVYNIYVITRDGYTRTYYVDFAKRTVECDVNLKDPSSWMYTVSTRRFTTSKFIFQFPKSKFVIKN